MPTTWHPYCGSAPLPGDWLVRWNMDPWLLAAMALVLVIGLRLKAQRPALIAAIMVMLLLFVSPLCALTSALFSVRVVHHVVLVSVVAPLLMASFGLRSVRLTVWTALHVVIFCGWHAPPAYAYALSSAAGYWLMQVSLLVSGIGFWASVRQAPAPAAVAALLVAMVAMGLLGALLTFAAAPLYPPHLATTSAWGFTPIEDQQLGGLIMWAPAALIYLAVALAIGWRLLGADRRAGAV